jgi:hypothetical protein
MAYEETPQEKQQRQSKEAANAAKGKAAEAKQDYEVFGSRGDAARKGMEEGRMDAMGNSYKKGGKVMDHKHKMEHEKKHSAGFQHEQDKASKHKAGHKMHHEHVKAMCRGGKAK